MAKTIDSSWAKWNGAPVQPGEPGPKNGGEGDVSYENILPWLMAGGLGLIGHSVAAPFFDDDEDKKQSVWRKLLGTLIPLGVGGLGAYGGYALGKSLMNKSGAAEPKIGPNTLVKFKYGDEEKVLPNNLGPWVNRVAEWGEGHGMPEESSSLEDTAESFRNSNLGWGAGETAFSIGTLFPFMKNLKNGIVDTKWRDVVNATKIPPAHGLQPGISVDWYKVTPHHALVPRQPPPSIPKRIAAGIKAIPEKSMKNFKSSGFWGLLAALSGSLAYRNWRTSDKNKALLNALEKHNP